MKLRGKAQTVDPALRKIGFYTLSGRRGIRGRFFILSCLQMSPIRPLVD